MTDANRSIVAVTCEACGGAVAMEVGRALPACLYCGSEALTALSLDETIEQPETFLPFDLAADDADAAFRTFTRSSIWYPREIRHSALTLQPLFLASWTWTATIETHFAGLTKAATRSKKRPFTGRDIARFEGVVVPSSSALTRGELEAIAPYSYSAEQAYDPQESGVMFEPGRLSRSVSRAQATEQMGRRHADQIAAQHNALSLNPASVLSDVDGRPILLPVYIGTWRYKDRPYRVLINGQTGRLTGKAPISWIKVGLAVGIPLVVFGILFVAMAVFAEWNHL